MSGNQLIQIVNGDGEFTPLDQLSVLFQGWDFLKQAFDYHVVAILGAQSSGKSTLLNLLFGTSFPVMVSSEGRTQTTLGVWSGLSSVQEQGKEEAIMVLDVEGTDSRERGEDAASFERKTSLFSLALSEVLLVNLWHNDIGRYNAGNVALLKTVFELNLQLFQKTVGGPRTILLFVIRDHVPKETPLEKLKATIMKDMNGIWEGLQKPQQFSNSKAEDFFEFQFTTLSHKVLAEDQFVEDVNNLRRRFLDPKSEGYILRPNFRTDIPADGFAPYAQRIWQTIKENKDLDLPTQKEMLAMFRCDEILAEAYAHFSTAITPIKKSIEKGDQITDFGAKVSEIYNSALQEYDVSAVRYHAEVASKKRANLSLNMSNELQSLYTKILQTAVQKAMETFKITLKSSLPSDGSASKDLRSQISSARSKAVSDFESSAKGALLADSNWSYELELNELEQFISRESKSTSQIQIEKLMNEMKTLFTNSLKSMDKILDDPNEQMWEKVRNINAQSKQKISIQFDDRLQGFDLSEEEVSKKKEELQSIAFQALRDKFKEKSKYLGYIMNKKFEQKFIKDERGLPRRWKPTDNVGDIFADARDSALKYLEKFSLLRMHPDQDSVNYLESNPDVDETHVILTHQEADVIRDKFTSEAESAYKQAVRDQEQVNSTAHIPMYIIVLLVVFGFDEAIHIVTSPILLFLCVILGGGFFVIHKLNMHGPVKTAVEAILNSSFSTLQVWLSDQMHKHNVHIPHGIAHGDQPQSPQELKKNE